MPKLRLTLFGKFQIYCGDQKLDIIETRKLQELFCYLLLFQGHPHSRESLTGLLWGESSITQSKKYLRQALWQLQSALDPYFDKGTNPLIATESDWIMVDPNADLWLDVVQFEKAYILEKGKPGKLLEHRDFEFLAMAARLYQGDLLEGCYEDWCLFERERLQNMYTEILDKLMEYCEEHHDYENGRSYGTLILRLDHARERTHRRLMRLYFLEGDRTGALRQYQRCEKALQEELGVAPSDRTKGLLEQIKKDHLEQYVLPRSTESHLSDFQGNALTQVLDSLNHLIDLHLEFQKKAQDALQSLERMLKSKP